MGPPKLSYERIAPPNSFIHVQDFSSPKDLAKSVVTSNHKHPSMRKTIPRYLLHLDSHPEEYLKYLGQWKSTVIICNNFNSVQRGKVNTEQNVLNLGVVNCVERCQRCKDQGGDKFRASSTCGRTVPATQTGLIRRGASNDGPAVPSHMGATQSLLTRSRVDEE